MSLLVGALVYALIAALIFGLVAATNWRQRAATDAEGAFARRVYDGVIVGVGVLLCACLSAAIGVVAMGVLAGVVGVRVPADDRVLTPFMIAGATAGAAYVGALHVPGGALRGVGVLAFAVLVGAGTWLSPLADLGLWREVASVAAGVVAAVVAAAGLFARPRES